MSVSNSPHDSPASAHDAGDPDALNLLEYWQVLLDRRNIVFLCLGVVLVLGLVLAGMTVWEVRSPCAPRRGLLPLVSTRGDRLFLGLLACAYVNLAWLGLTDTSPLGGFTLSLAALGAVSRWG